MYIPKGGVTLENEPIEQIRMGIQGFYGTGKTIAASTFPNPVYMDIDRGLGALSGRSDIIKLKFYDNDFCKQINPNHKGFNTLRDTVLMFLDKEAKKLEADQTLVVDGSTGLQNAYHAWYDENPVVTKTGSIDDRAVWRLKLNFFGDICETLKTLRCNVLYIAHEYEKPDSSGEYNGKIRPLMSGQFCN